MGVDLSSPATFVQGMPWDEFARRRRDAPVSWCEESAYGPWPEGPGFWGVFSYQDIVEVNRNPDRFSSHIGATQIRDPAPEDLRFVQEMVLNMDPPDHTRLRRVVSRSFTPRASARLADGIEARARSLVDAVTDAGHCDFVRDVSADLPVATLADVMGVPQSDRHLLYDWSNRVIGYQDDEYGQIALDDEGRPINPRSRAALSDMFDYAHELANAKLKDPGDDLLSVLLHADVDSSATTAHPDESRLTVEQYENFFFLLSVAGNETVRNGLPGALMALIEDHEAWNQLRDDPSLFDTAIDELLRFAPPVIHFRRTARVDTELAGVPIAAGEKVVVFYASGNRDETVFREPDRLLLDRHPNPHLSFGVGPHLCLGAHLARLQMRAMLSRVIERWEDVQLDGPAVRLGSSFQSGYKSLPIRFRARPPGG